MLGFKRYAGLENIEYIQPDVITSSIDVRDKYEDILDIIYTVDPVTKFPSGAYQMLLSEKTSDDVRRFISDYLMNNNQSSGLDVPDNVLEQYRQLPTEFLAQIHPSAYETSEQYEARINDYVNRYNQEEEFKRRYDELFVKYNK